MHARYLRDGQCLFSEVKPWKTTNTLELVPVKRHEIMMDVIKLLRTAPRFLAPARVTNRGNDVVASMHNWC